MDQIATATVNSGPVTQPWVNALSFMQQSVLLSAIRGCDGIAKRHKAKVVVKWYRRCVLLSAFDGRALTDPFESGGGSFTGPIAELPPHHEGYGDMMVTGMDISLYDWKCSMLQRVADDFVDSRDELPQHYQTHMMHAFEIIGYKHPDAAIRDYFKELYERLAHAFHLWPETEEQMDKRLGDNEVSWRARMDRSTSCSD